MRAFTTRLRQMTSYWTKVCLFKPFHALTVFPMWPDGSKHCFKKSIPYGVAGQKHKYVCIVSVKLLWICLVAFIAKPQPRPRHDNGMTPGLTCHSCCPVWWIGSWHNLVPYSLFHSMEHAERKPTATPATQPMQWQCFFFHKWLQMVEVHCIKFIVGSAANVSCCVGM